MVNPNRFYTYAYLREDRTPYYIGKGTRKRINSTNRSGLKPPKDKSRIIFLKQNLTEEEAFKHEKYMISVFGRIDLGTGILYNKTDGGDGCSGRVVSEEQKINQRDVGVRCYKMRIGIHGRTKEQMTEDGKKSAETHKRNGTGFYNITPEERFKRSRRGGERAKELGLGIHGRTKEQMIEDCKKGGKINGKKTYELGVGIHGIPKQQRIENGSKGGKISTSQKWMCLESGYVTNAGALTCYQRKRGIDTSKRKRIE